MLRWAVEFKWWSALTKGPIVCQEHASLNHYISLAEPLIQHSVNPCFYVVYDNFWPYWNTSAEIVTHHNRQRCSNLLFSNSINPIQMITSTLFYADRKGFWCSLLLMAPIKVHDFNEWLFEFSFSSYQLKEVLWPLTSARHFCSKNCCSTDILSFSDNSL